MPKLDKLTLAEITPSRLKKVPQQELLSLHRRAHQWFANARRDRRAVEAIVNAHRFIVDEMKDRGLSHSERPGLDTAAVVPKAAPYHDEEARRDRVIVQNYVSVGGSAAREGWEEARDLDIVIREDPEVPQYYKDNIYLLLRRFFDPDKTGKQLHILYNPQGTHDGAYIPMFDLVLRSSDDRPMLVKSVRRSALHPAPFERYRVQKPSMKLFTDFVSVNELWDNFAEKMIDESRAVLVSPKVDGLRTIIHSGSDGRALIYFEDAKEDKTKQLPGLTAAIKKLGRSFIIEGELAVKSGGKWLARPDIMSFLAGKVKGTARVYLYDILYIDGEGIPGDTFESRLSALRPLAKALGPAFIALPQVRVKDKRGLKAAARAALKYSGPDIEGVVVRDPAMPYAFGSTNRYVKVKKWLELKVYVLDAVKVKNGWVYESGLKVTGDSDLRNVTRVNGFSVLSLGRTFVSKTKLASKGDTLNVMVEELLSYPDGNVAWGKPTPMGPDKSRGPYSVGQAVDLARRFGVLKEMTEKSLEKGRPVGSPWMDDEILDCVDLYRKYLERGVTPEKAYAYLMQGRDLETPGWFGTRHDEMGYFLLHLEHRGLLIPETQLRIDPNEGEGPDMSWTTTSLLEVWRESLASWGKEWLEGETADEREAHKTKPRRDQCMACKRRPPVVEVLWAEGMARAWFCATCFKSWKKEHEDDIVRTTRLPDGVATAKALVTDGCFDDVLMLEEQPRRDGMYSFPSGAIAEVLCEDELYMPDDEGRLTRQIPADVDEEGGRGGAAARYWFNNWFEALPDSGKGRFMYHHHWRGLTEEEAKDLDESALLDTSHSVHGDLRLEGDKDLWGWTVFLGRAADNRKQGGDKLVAGKDTLQVGSKLAQPKAWLTVAQRKPAVAEPGEAGATREKYSKFFAYDRGTYRVGVVRRSFVELFIYGNKLKGRYLVQLAAVGEGGRKWLMKRGDDEPYVETHKLAAVLKELRTKRQKYLVWGDDKHGPFFIELSKHADKLLAALDDDVDQWVALRRVVKVEDDAPLEVVPGYIAQLHEDRDTRPARLAIADDPEQPRYWNQEAFEPALQRLAEVLDSPGELDVGFFPSGTGLREATPLCDLLVHDDSMELVKAAGLRLTLLGVGAMKSPKFAPAGLLVEAGNVRVMLDGGEGPSGVAVPKGDLDAWLVTDEHDEQHKTRSDLAEHRGVKARAGNFHQGGVTITAHEVTHTSHTSYGYLIEVGRKKIVWAPEFLKFPSWAKGAHLMFAEAAGWNRPILFSGGAGGHAAVDDVAAAAKKAGVKRLVFAHIGRPSIEAMEDDKQPEFGEWGVDGSVYTPARGAMSLTGSELLLGMEVTEKAASKQYTFGVVYKATEEKQDPELDAHREFILADDLQEAQWEYVRTGDRRIYFQHGQQGIIPLGEWVDLVTWPREVTAELTLPGQKAKTTTIPAGSVWMGVLWNDMGWDLVKTGQIRGFSLGGFQRKTKRGVPTEDDVI